MIARELPSAEYLRECFDYNQATGDLVWKIRPLHHFKTKRSANRVNSTYAGKKAGAMDADYVRISLDGSSVYAHRIIWAMHFGPPPLNMDIDHENTIKSDNRLRNLRLATRSQNKGNYGCNSNNKCGLRGVSKTHKGNKWVAVIGGGKSKRKIGSFLTPEEAHEAYRDASIDHFGEFSPYANKELSI